MIFLIWIILGILIAVFIMAIVFWDDICREYTRKKYKRSDIRARVRHIIDEIYDKGPEDNRENPYFDQYLSKIDDIFVEFKESIPCILRSKEYVLKIQGKARRRALEALEDDYRRYKQN